MDHLYNVVWADDNIDTLLQDTKERFLKYGIQITPFHAARPAIEYIESNASFIDAIITDAKYSKAGEAVTEEGKDVPGLSVFITELSRLRKETGQPLPCWIYTGYGDLLLDKYDPSDLEVFVDIIDKKADYETTKEWLTSMCTIIADTKTASFKLRQDNPVLFSLCTDSYLGKDTEKTMMDILSYDGNDEIDPFNRIRDILEEVMDLLVRKGFIGGNTAKTAINDRIDKFCSANKNNIPQYIQPSMKLLLTSSSLSHSDTREKTEVLEGRAPYMYETLLITLKTLLIWLKSFLDSNQPEMQTAPKVSDGADKKKDSQPDSVDTSLLNADLMGTEVGNLSVKTWNVRIGNRFVNISRDKVERSWRPGMKIRVRIAKNYRGEEEVSEVVRLEQ